MKLGMLTACLPGSSLGSLAYAPERRHRYGWTRKAVEHEDPVWGGTEDRVRTGLEIAYRTLRPLIVA